MADDVGLPKSSLQKAIKDLLPGEMRIAGDASDLLVQCCNQFVHLVSTQVGGGCCAAAGRDPQLSTWMLARLVSPQASAPWRQPARSPLSPHVRSPVASCPAWPTPQANSVSEREKRSTISPADVVRALEELEFGEQYVEAVKAGEPRRA